jgi:hypothetical protein
MYGTELIAHYLDRGAEDVTIWLDVGGACWTGACQADTTADATSLAMGRFERHPELARFNVVFIPYRDGSVYSGVHDEHVRRDVTVTLPSFP